MRLLIVAYDQGIDETVMERLADLDLPGWTKVFDAQGSGGTGTKRGDPVWPGLNNMLYLELPEEKAREVVRVLRNIQSTYRLKPGITIWSLPVDVL